MHSSQHPHNASDVASNYSMFGFDSINQRSSINHRSYPASESGEHQIKSNNPEMGANGSPASPCTWRKYLPLTNGQLRLVNHRISAHPDGPLPMELGSTSLSGEILKGGISNQSNVNVHWSSVSQDISSHLSDTECGRKVLSSSSSLNNRQPVSYGQLLGSPMISRRSTGGQSKFQSLEKNLKLLKPTLQPSITSSTTAPITRPNTLLRRQTSLMSETTFGCSASKPNRSLLDQRTTSGFGSSLSVASAVTAPVDTPAMDRTSGGEMRKLRRELQLSHQKVGSLTNQLNTNVSN